MFRVVAGLGGLSAATFGTWRFLDRHDVSHVTRSKSPGEVSLTNFYQSYQSILDSHVCDGKVDYYTLSKDEKLSQCVALAEKLGPRSSPSEFEGDDRKVLAYYINLYNLLTMCNVVFHSKEQLSLISSVMNTDSPLGLQSIIGSRADGYGFFISSRFTVDGTGGVSLDYLENKLIRGFGDAKIHTAINCASASCPKLQSKGFGFERTDGGIRIDSSVLEQQLEQAASEFVNSKFHVNFNFGQRKVYLSKIFEWYTDDFEKCEDYSGVPEIVPSLAGGTSGDVACLKFIYKYGNESTKEKVMRLTQEGKYNVLFNQYDWSLNKQADKTSKL